MNIAQTALASHLSESRRAAYLHEVKVAAGKASAAARRARGELDAQMRALAPRGAKARGPLSPDAQHRLAVAGGRAGWKKLSPEEARAKRMRAAAKANQVITHEKRVEIGRKGALTRWGKR